MPTKVVLGLQHGDEGKGRVVDDLTQTWADIIVRFQGGGNAGHTVYDKEGNKHVTHILPVGCLTLGKMNFIARGCVVNVVDLIKEIKEFNVTPESLSVSGYCPIITFTHKIIDRDKYQGKIGTTAKGIGPAYSDFYARDGLLIKDLIENREASFNKIKLDFFNYQQLRSQEGASYKQVSKDYDDFNIWFMELLEASKAIRTYIQNIENMISVFYETGKNILIEGAQGSGLDVYSDNYPNVTSSSPSIGGVLNSTGLNHKQIDEVIGVIKSYKTKVGSGEFKSRCNEEDEKVLAHHGKEFGATTGRPRMCGWLDLDEVNVAIRRNGVDHLCIVKTDVMTHVEKPMIYCNKKTSKLLKINDVSLNDEGFKNLLDIIKDETSINVVSFTTGPKRGEIVWAKQ